MAACARRRSASLPEYLKEGFSEIVALIVPTALALVKVIRRPLQNSSRLLVTTRRFIEEAQLSLALHLPKSVIISKLPNAIASRLDKRRNNSQESFASRMWSNITTAATSLLANLSRGDFQRFCD